MWNSWVASSTAATQQLASALERTGDVLTERATAHLRYQAEERKKKEGESKDASSSESSEAATSTTAESSTGGENLERENANEENVEGERDEEKPYTGIGSGALLAGLFSSATAALATEKGTVEICDETPDSDSSAAAAAASKLPSSDQMAAFGKKLQVGFGSVVEATRHAVDVTREVVEKEQTRIQTQGLFRRGPYRRDPSLPLDVESLRDAEVVYITDRLITMGHPAMQSNTDGDITPERKLAAIGHLLQKRHAGKYMVWNISEVEYDYSVLEDQVLTYQFPGSPSPPLGLLLKLLLSVESWLRADKANVAVLHCLTGRGRTSIVLAAFLCWTGEAQFHDPNEALQYIADCRRCTVEELTIPSQRRYASYFSNMLDGVRPSQPPLLLKRIIMSEAPRFGKRPRKKNKSKKEDDGEDPKADKEKEEAEEVDNELGCSPYLQIFKGGRLIFTTAASVSYGQAKDDLPFCTPASGPVSFPVETVVQGDVLVRCRHLTAKGQRISMYRAAFHTGYVPPKVLRLVKSQLDGACNDGRFADDFFLDLIFEACDAEMASKHLLPSEEAAGTGEAKSADNKTTSSSATDEGTLNSAAARRMLGTVAASAKAKEEDDGNNNQTDSLAAEKIGGSTVTATVYDSMLHGDSRFWDVISMRRDENMKRMAAAAADGGVEASKTPASPPVSGNSVGSNPSLYGPTIGRRRDFSAKQQRGDKEKDSSQSPSSAHRRTIDAFSIGGGFDFLADDNDGDEGDNEDDAKKSADKPPKRDELMEALMALDDDAPASPASPAGPAKVPASAASQMPKMPEGSAEDEDEEEEIVLEKDETPKEESGEDDLTDVPIAPMPEEGRKTVEAETADTNTTEKNASDPPVPAPTPAPAPAPAPALGDIDLEPSAEEMAALQEAGDGGGDDDYNFDDDDDELQDLENFLTKAKAEK